MIILKIDVKGESKKYTEKHFLSDDYVVSKTNDELKSLVSEACKKASFEDVEQVVVTAKFEW